MIPCVCAGVCVCVCVKERVVCMCVCVCVCVCWEGEGDTEGQGTGSLGEHEVCWGLERHRVFRMHCRFLRLACFAPRFFCFLCKTLTVAAARCRVRVSPLLIFIVSLLSSSSPLPRGPGPCVGQLASCCRHLHWRCACWPALTVSAKEIYRMLGRGGER